MLIILNDLNLSKTTLNYFNLCNKINTQIELLFRKKIRFKGSDVYCFLLLLLFK